MLQCGGRYVVLPSEIGERQREEVNCPMAGEAEGREREEKMPIFFGNRVFEQSLHALQDVVGTYVTLLCNFIFLS